MHTRTGRSRRRWLRAVIPIVALFAGVPGPARPADGDKIILDATRYDILAGRYSVFARFQESLQRTLNACGKGTPPVVPAGEEPTGRIGVATREGIQRALECAALRDVPRDSPAKDGVLTESVWRAVMGRAPLPTVHERADALILSYEATDFGDAPEWNLCQDGQRGELRPSKGGSPDFVCYNESDPCSFLTWGPRGATAGAGREIQWVLWMAWHRSPGEIESAFGSELDSLQRFFRLKGGGKKNCDGDIPVKHFLCAIWTDPPRRKAWEDALAKLGHSENVRRAYAELYASEDFDGAKLRDYASLWKKLGLRPTEVDYAFFLDRITHLGEPPDEDDEVLHKMRACIQKENRAISINAAARRCLSHLQPHDTQADYRLARDVGYYLDAYPEGALTEKEIQAWAGYVPLSAVHNFGLSDVTPARIPNAAPMSSLGAKPPHAGSSELTSSELRGCPAGVLWPVHRRPPRQE